MTLAFAIAFAIAGAALVTAAFVVWRHEDEPGIAAVLGVPGVAFVYAGIDFIVRALP